MPARTCPRCNGTGTTAYRKDFGICYRCNGWGTLNADGSKKVSRAEMEQRLQMQRADALIDQYKYDPRFQPMKDQQYELHQYDLNGSDFYSDYAVAKILYQYDNQKPFEE